jgi:hypothetical protein
MMKQKYFSTARIFVLLLFILSGQDVYSQWVNVVLNNGIEVRGWMSSYNKNAIILDPDGAIRELRIKRKDIGYFKHADSGEIFVFSDIKSKGFVNHAKHYRNVPLYKTNAKSRIYSGFYLLSGYSYGNKKFGNIEFLSEQDGVYYSIPLKSKYGPIFGLGFFFLVDTPNNQIDWAFDFEMSFSGKTLLAEQMGQEVKLTSGTITSLESCFSLFPLNKRNRSAFSPFLNAGGGFAFGGFGDSSFSETRLKYVLGFGYKWQISNACAIQIKQRFVGSRSSYSNSFFVPETRIEFYISLRFENM